MGFAFGRNSIVIMMTITKEPSATVDFDGDEIVSRDLSTNSLTNCSAHILPFHFFDFCPRLSELDEGTADSILWYEGRKLMPASLTEDWSTNLD